MEIRGLKKSDALALQECRLFGLAESPEAFLASYADLKDTSLSQVESELEDTNIHYLGAFNDHDLVGFMRYARPLRLSRRHTAEVRSVYVKKAMRREGVAKRLLSQLIQDARDAGLESLILSVLASNIPARSLYEAAGFVVYGNEPRAIKKGGSYVDQTHLWLALAAT